MGGQAFPGDGVEMTLDVKPAERWIAVNRDAKTCRVAAGARWRQVIGALDPWASLPR
jgi:FAD/FMN-containing dehydrogenase